MRILILLSMIMSVSAFAQTRVRENIKQQTIISEEGVEKVVKQTVSPIASKPAITKKK